MMCDLLFCAFTLAILSSLFETRATSFQNLELPAPVAGAISMNPETNTALNRAAVELYSKMKSKYKIIDAAEKVKVMVFLRP
jgi:hypothetical protein